jgi:hypothetical protein
MLAKFLLEDCHGNHHHDCPFLARPPSCPNKPRNEFHVRNRRNAEPFQHNLDNNILVIFHNLPFPNNYSLQHLAPLYSERCPVGFSTPL